MIKFLLIIMIVFLQLLTADGSAMADKNLIKTAKSYLGTKYQYGGTSHKGMDCSGFVKTVYSKRRKLPRTSREQARVGKPIQKKNLQPGDLVFFGTAKRGHINHVGIYLGSKKFIHASSGARRVTITSLDKKFYSTRLLKIRRV